jgi:hypothetical protein
LQATGPFFIQDNDHQELATLKLADRSAQLRAVGVRSAGRFSRNTFGSGGAQLLHSRAAAEYQGVIAAVLPGGTVRVIKKATASDGTCWFTRVKHGAQKPHQSTLSQYACVNDIRLR